MNKWKNYLAPNLGLLFYKNLYKDIPQDIIKCDEKKIEFKPDEKKSEFHAFYTALYEKQIQDYIFDTEHLAESFTLYTTYPGLLIGSGYSHSTKAVGDSSIGFYFDHTTGLPVIPGSSVKGVLRSLFELDIKEKKEFTGPKSLKAIQFIIQEILNYEKNNLDLQNILQELDEKKLSLIKQEIFGAQDDEGKDMFFDAVIDFENTRSGKFMGSDFITPHQPKLLKNPTPIQFIKVLPNIGFKFRFTLKDSPNCTSDLKKLIFKHILLTLGIGAKTNVGYGQFSEVTVKTGLNIPPIYHDPYIEEIPTEAIQFLKKTNSPFEVIVSRVTDKHNYFEFQVGKNLIVVRKKIDSNPSLKLGDQAKLRIESDYHGTHNLHFKII